MLLHYLQSTQFISHQITGADLEKLTVLLPSNESGDKWTALWGAGERVKKNGEKKKERASIYQLNDRARECVVN